MTASGWQFWIDRGGTFTDVIGCAPDQTLHSLKLLSENPEHYRDAAAEGIHRVLAAHSPGAAVDEIRMGTTVATNALLERAGAATGLLLTRGFGDAPRIGQQNRPAIFDLHIRKPEPLFTAAAEISGRIDAQGQVLEPLDENALKTQLDSWQQAGLEALAISLTHAWRNPEHEQQAVALAHAAGFTQVSASHEVSPLIKLISRSDTTVADAYLSPVLTYYIDNFRQALESYAIACPHILFMQSNGGLVTHQHFRGKDSVLSGPAGGVVGMAAAAQTAGASHLIGFDMGGTSTDVSVFTDTPEIEDETRIAGITMRTPMIGIHTIAAGGGSILRFADGRFQAGPESAGANPGPKCYGRGGPLTVTDANLMLGRIQAGHFPASFGETADQPLDKPVVADAFASLAMEISAATGREFTPEQTADGFLRIAVENMANALRHISVERGLHPREFTLCSFGGAGGQHACQVADQLGMQRILLDPMAGVLSAFGIGAAPLRSYRQQSVEQMLNRGLLTTLGKQVDELATACHAELRAQGIAAQAITQRTWLNLKQSGSDTAIELPLQTLDNLQQAFSKAHIARFGFMPDNNQLIVESLRVEAEADTKQPSDHAEQASADTPQTSAAPEALEHSKMYIGAKFIEVPVYARSQLSPGMLLTGPAIVSETTGTIVLEQDWTLEVNTRQQLLLTRAQAAAQHEDIGITCNPVMLEVFSNRFMHIAEEMGAVLQNTAGSVNIKERLDFSCALFSPQGDLIANAPHIPVHLGSMDESIKSLLHEHAAGLASGNVYLSNAPYNGGTHLPDLTIASPVCDTSGRLLFVVASRAHHADIGGISPGSMPAQSQHIDEEGVVFDNFPVIMDGEFQETALREKLESARYPARNATQNIADCKAQLAANERGKSLLLELITQYGISTVHAYAEHTLQNAEESVREAIARLAKRHPELLDDNKGSTTTAGRFTYPFDNGQELQVSIRLDQDRREAHIDFTGTSNVTNNNLNAPISVCQAAVMYVFRTLVDKDIPLNAGCARPLHLYVPTGCMLNPEHPAAVVGGNVETSQCITDALYGALGVLAASQGTMNNLSFGNTRLQYYETICGGAGAGEGFAGADAVQTHMTNSRMTDPEVLESRFPVLVREFSIRDGSGGAGKYRGGNGVIRKLEFRESMSAAILSNHRRVAPFGLQGGEDASVGRNRIERQDGTIEDLDGIVAIELQQKDVLVIETPGGGGYGKPPEQS